MKELPSFFEKWMMEARIDIEELQKKIRWLQLKLHVS